MKTSRYGLNILYALILSLLTSVSAGFFFYQNGWRCGALFLVVCIIIGLYTYTLRNVEGYDAVSKLMPTFIMTAAIVAVSVFGSFAGFTMRGANADLMDLAFYLIAILVFGFASTCLSVRNAVFAEDKAFNGGLFFSLIIYAILFVGGLIIAASTIEMKSAAAVGYIVIGAGISLYLMSTSSRNMRF